VTWTGFPLLIQESCNVILGAMLLLVGLDLVLGTGGLQSQSLLEFLPDDPFTRLFGY